ncbi:MAG: EcsC family protein [Acidobacteriota bacterium]
MTAELAHFADTDLKDLAIAKSKLEYPGMTAKIADLFGKPLEAGFKLLPKNWNEKVAEITQAALLKGLEFAIRTMGESESRGSRDWLHKILVTGSGVAGGAIGLSSLFVELPISTTIILRSIADIARGEGHDISLLEVKLSCLEVLAFGGASPRDDSAAEGYWMVRAALAKAVSEAAAYITEKGLGEKAAPPLIRLIATIASRFSVVVTEEVAAKAVPILGAAAGGTINYLFMDHFQEMARGHFIIKRLEKKYGTALVEKTYSDLII